MAYVHVSKREEQDTVADRGAVVEKIQADPFGAADRMMKGAAEMKRLSGVIASLRSEVADLQTKLVAERKTAADALTVSAAYAEQRDRMGHQVSELKVKLGRADTALTEANVRLAEAVQLRGEESDALAMEKAKIGALSGDLERERFAARSVRKRLDAATADRSLAETRVAELELGMLELEEQLRAAHRESRRLAGTLGQQDTELLGLRRKLEHAKLEQAYTVGPDEPAAPAPAMGITITLRGESITTGGVDDETLRRALQAAGDTIHLQLAAAKNKETRA